MQVPLGPRVNAGIPEPKDQCRYSRAQRSMQVPWGPKVNAGATRPEGRCRCPGAGHAPSGSDSSCRAGENPERTAVAWLSLARRPPGTRPAPAVWTVCFRHPASPAAVASALRLQWSLCAAVSRRLSRSKYSEHQQRSVHAPSVPRLSGMGAGPWRHRDPGLPGGTVTAPLLPLTRVRETGNVRRAAKITHLEIAGFRDLTLTSFFFFFFFSHFSHTDF